MRFSLTIVSTFCVALVAATGNKDGCNHDNCLRAVIGNAFPEREGVKDCKAYLVTTITPPPKTTTVTKTVVVKTVPPKKGDYYRRDDYDYAPSYPTLPPYADKGCKGDKGRYVSACSCVGVTPYKTYLPTPTVTETVTVTVTKPLLEVTAYKGSGCYSGYQKGQKVANGECVDLKWVDSVKIGNFGPKGCDSHKCKVKLFKWKNNCSGKPDSVIDLKQKCVNTDKFKSLILLCDYGVCGGYYDY